VLKITPDGKVTTILQLEDPWAPTDVAVFGDILYVLEFTHDAGDEGGVESSRWRPSCAQWSVVLAGRVETPACVHDETLHRACG